MLTARMNLGVGAIKDMRDAVTGATFSAIYAIGGYSGKSILGSAEKYDMETDTWTEIAPMKTPRRNVGVAVINNLLYAVGGSNRDDGTRSNLNSMERYNPDRDEWEEMPPMHRSRGAASVTALGGCLYAVGGYDSG
jgi:N-acetylneuraminic acid mutarotase